MTLRVTWFDALKCEIAYAHAKTQEDAAEQLICMIRDAGGYLEEGDAFTVTHVPDEEDEQS